MSNPTQRAYLASRLAQKSLTGVTVTVSRGLTTSALLTATVGKSGSVSYEADGTQTFAKNRDYLIEVSAYIIGSLTTPQRFDVITEVINGTAKTFEVLDADGDDGSTSTDSSRTVYRIHTKEV